MKEQVSVVGSGPNGLAAAITMLKAGYEVTVYEASETVGGGARSAEVTLPGFIHDVCSAVHPMAVTSPFFLSLPLEHFGLEWIHPPVPFAHPLDGGKAVFFEKSLESTAQHLGGDGTRYVALLKPFVENWRALFAEIFQPAVPLRIPISPLLVARFARLALRSAQNLSETHFRETSARALFLGVAAHANCPLDRPGTAGIALALLIAGHARGWPIARGGSQKLSDALQRYFESLGGRIQTNKRISSLAELPKSASVFFDVMPDQALRIAHLPHSVKHRGFRHGNGVFKIDWALSSPIPWLVPELARAGTLHLGASPDELVIAERASQAGAYPDRPYVLLSQPSLFDSSRAPQGQHTAWGYCHVPRGSTADMREAIELQIERFAPGFRTHVMKATVLTTEEIERKNPNMVGGDIGGGEFSLRRSLVPNGLLNSPYCLDRERGLYLCSSATPPGPGVHGMCGVNAATLALKRR